MKTLVIKLLDFIQLSQPALIQVGYAHTQLSWLADFPTWAGAYKRFFDTYTYKLSYGVCNPVEPTNFIKALTSNGWQLKPLFDGSQPTQLEAVITMVAELQHGQYNYVNFFNYFQITASTEEINEIYQKLAQFTYTDMADPVEFPIDFIYQKGTLTLAGEATPPDQLRKRIDSSNALQLNEFRQNYTQFYNSIPPQKTVGIHDIEYAWDTSPVLPALDLDLGAPDTIPITLRYGIPQDDTVAKNHGRSVLELIFAQPTVTTNAGIAPNASGFLYSANSPVSYKENDLDDALLNAIFQAKSKPGDVIVMPVQFAKRPLYHPTDLARVDYYRYPIETEPALYDLIFMATRLLKLIVVEAAGNISGEKARPILQGGVHLAFDLDSYHYNHLPDFCSRYSSEVTVTFSDPDAVNAELKAFYATCVQRKRTLSFDKDHDSGAIMVGAAYWTIGDQWNCGSNYGSRIDTYAPGDEVPTSDQNFCGTSSASALVAGCLAACQMAAKNRNSCTPLKTQPIRDTLRPFLSNTPTALVKVFPTTDLDKKLQSIVP